MKWVTLPSGKRRVEVVLDAGMNPVTGKRRQVRRRFASEDEAKKAQAKMSHEVANGVFITRSTKTVEVVCRDWLAGRRLRPATLANYADVLKPLRVAHGSMPVQRLEKAHIDALVTSLTLGGLSMSNGRPRRLWSPRSCNLMLTVLQMVLDDAMRQGWLMRNVARLVDRVPQTKHEMQTFTEVEVRKLLKAVESERLELAWHLALSGLRRGEVCGLRWEDVDLEAGTLTIRHTRVRVDGAVLGSTPKTDAGNRVLPLPDALGRVFRRARAMQAEDRLHLGVDYLEAGYVVADLGGSPIHPETLTFAWGRLLTKAGVRQLRLHDARHTCGTLMHLRGVPVAVIAAWLGHADAAFTMRTYVHSQDDALVSAASVLDVVTSA